MAPREIFAAREHLDPSEGKGGLRVVGWFATSEAAQRVSDGLVGVMGTPNNLPIEPAVLYDSAEEYPGFSVTDETRRLRIAEPEAELAELKSQR